jgi:hypothetical protein
MKTRVIQVIPKEEIGKQSMIVGMGEVGTSLFRILKKYYKVGTRDLYKVSVQDIPVDILHICFNYSDDFVNQVKAYQEEYKPEYTVIHSTVPVGVSRKCNAIHSPIRGLHPNLESGILTFPKFLGGEQASQIADYFRRADIKVILCGRQETTEAMKLFDTEYYRHCVEFAHRVKKYCDKHSLNFHEVYTLSNETYNEGYTKLGHPEFVRPVLQPIMKEIGGHCLIPNKGFISQSE